MSAPIKDIVNVTINRESINISRVGFSTVLVLGGNANFPERLKYFSDLPSLALALHGGVNSLQYKAAQAVFSQSPKVAQIAIGHRGANIIITENAGTYTAGTITGLVNGHAISIAYDTDKATTLGNLATAIAAVDGITSAVYAANAITVVPDAATVASISLDVTAVAGTMTIIYSTVETEDSADALDAIQAYDFNWYGVISTSRATADVEAIAAWVEATPMKFFVTASSDANIVDESVSADTTSIAALFKNNSYLKTAVVFHTLATTQYADAALLGVILPLDPGSYTAAFKTLSGITVDNLSASQRVNAFAKFANVYEYVAGVNILRKGTVSGNEYIDVMIFIDWLDARCTEAVFAVLVGNQKVPYTDVGIASIQNALSQPLKAGQNVGGISPTAYDSQKKQIGGFYIIVPRLEDISTIDKTARELNGVKFVAYLAGAIQYVAIQGYVTY
jgi:hypothetical protein